MEFEKIAGKISDGIAGIVIDVDRADGTPEICPYSDPAHPHARKPDCEDGYLIDKGGFKGHCPCYLAYKQRRNVDSYLDQFGVEMRCEILQARYDIGALKVVVDQWWCPAAKLPATQALLLSGEPGTGKTLAAHATAVRLMRATNNRVLFLWARNVGRWLSDMASPDQGVSQSAREKLEDVYECFDPDRWMLVIDDLGRERISGTMPQHIADILAGIYESRMRVIISTNLSSRQVGDRYGSEIKSRLLDGSWITPIRCSGEDLRIKRNDI
ncbi:MAG: ATP-binding protein [Candidatus Omnitrophica bacterium]|nr:ATP-binding protein [Candidatus Omnitrophota bacterium]